MLNMWLNSGQVQLKDKISLKTCKHDDFRTGKSVKSGINNIEDSLLMVKSSYLKNEKKGQ